MFPPAPQGYSAGIWGYTKKVCPGPLALLLIAIFVSLVFRYTYEKEIAVEAKRNSTDRKCCSTGKFNNLIGATAWHVLGSVHEVRAEVSDGTCGSINKLQHPLLLAAANPFCRTPLNNLWELLEFHRNVGHLVYLDTLDAVSAWTSHGTMQGSMGTVSETDSEVSTANAAPTGAYGRVGCDEMEYTGQVFRPDVRHCCRTLHL